MIRFFALKISQLPRWQSYLVALFVGGLSSLSQAPFDLGWVCFFTFPVLVWLLDGTAVSDGSRESPRNAGAIKAAIIGWWFGFGYFVAGLWWLGSALLVEADQFAWAIPLAVLGLPAVLAFFYSFATAFAYLFWGSGLVRILALGLGFGLAEWGRSFLLTGFPWNMIGYAAMPIPLLMQSVNLAGIIGISALAVVVFASPSLFAGGRFARSGIALAVILVVIHTGFGWWQMNFQMAETAGENKPVTVRIVQPSIRQDLKWDEFERRNIFETYIRMTEAPPKGGAIADYIIWPETSVPYILSQNPEVLERIDQALKPGQILLAGVVREEKDPQSGHPRYYNSITVVNDLGQVTDSFDKVHLVPFGEYLPFEGLLRSLGLQEIAEMPGGFTAGEYRHSLTITSGTMSSETSTHELSILPLICYEAIFPDELEYRGHPASVMINITNDAWYGNTPGPYQHMRQAQLRAVEQGMPMIRAANNGISAVVDSYGRIISQLGLNEIGVLDVSIPPKRTLFLGRVAGGFESGLILILLFAGAVLCKNNKMSM